MNVILIIIKTIKNAESTVILNESVKLIRHLASFKKVIEILYEKEVELDWFSIDTRENYWRENFGAEWHLYPMTALGDYLYRLFVY
jgi:hypothetical protein